MAWCFGHGGFWRPAAIPHIPHKQKQWLTMKPMNIAGLMLQVAELDLPRVEDTKTTTIERTNKDKKQSLTKLVETAEKYGIIVTNIKYSCTCWKHYCTIGIFTIQHFYDSTTKSCFCEKGNCKKIQMIARNIIGHSLLVELIHSLNLKHNSRKD